MKAFIKVLGLGFLLLLMACAARAMTVQEAKLLPDTNHVSLTGKVVTYAGTGFFYIEEDSRSMGIRIDKAGHSLSAGMRADVEGYIYTDPESNERYVLADTAVQSAAPDNTGTVAPVATTIQALGGGDWSVSGTGGQKGITGARALNNIGLLVKTGGQFQQLSATTFTISDGVNTSVECSVPAGTFLSATWQSVQVKGIVSICYRGGVYKPLLLIPADGIDVVLPTEVVSAPGTPAGETGPLVNMSYGYTTTPSTCSQGHSVEYSFDWGDGTSSPWSTATTAAHLWTTAGAKTVTVTARCYTHTGVTATSAALTVTPVTQLTASPWPMFRHDYKHSGVSPYHDPVPYGDVWSLNVGNGLSSPAIGRDGTIYLSGKNPDTGSGTLSAVNSDGTPKWSRNINSVTRSSPAIGSFLSGGNTYTYIYIGGNGLLYAFDTAGTQKWTYSLDADVSSSPVIGPDGTVYIATKGSFLYALTPGISSATQKWATGIGKMDVNTPCLSADGSIVYAAAGTQIRALYASSGNTKWSYDFGTATTSSCALSPNGAAVYIGSGNNFLYSFSTASTNTNVIVNWSTQIDFTQSVTSSSPAIGPDGTIYLSSNYGTLYAFNPDGSQKWTFDTGASDIRASAAVNADGTVILASYDGYVRGLDSATGAEKWHYMLPGTLYTSPAIAANGTIVTANMGGMLYGNIGGVRPAPVAPSDLALTLTSDTSVSLSWSDSSSDEYGFRIEKRRGTTGAWTAIPRATGGIPTVNAGVTTYDDSGLQTGQIYYYRVCAYGPGGDSLYSNVAGIITGGIETPADPVATMVSSTQVDLAWTDRSSGESGFIIERMLGPNGLFEEIAEVGPDATSYSDLTVYPGMNYYYRIKSFDSTRVSTGSDEAWVLTAPLTPSGVLSPITSGNASRKQIALTFDAGFPPIRPNISTNLKNALAYSTFFITGQAAEYDGSNIAKLAADGMHVCNHTYTHPNLRYTTDEAIADQFNRTDDIIYARTATATTNASHTRSFFRAPYGALNQHAYDAAAADGFRSVYWTRDSGDSAGAASATIRANAKAGAANGAIILFHCTMSTTDSAVPGIISDLQGLGYELVTVPELIAPTQVTSPAGHLAAGWNLISLPIDPALGFPHIIFRGLTINNNLKRWNRGTGTNPGSEAVYTTATPKTFGNIEADQAYWLYLTAGTTIKVNGTAAATARHIRLQYTEDPTDHTTYGLIGYPFQTGQSLGNCQVYNPAGDEPKTRSMADAALAGWVPDTFYGITPGDTPTEYGVTSSDMLEPWHGYKGACLVPGCELIIPKP